MERVELRICYNENNATKLRCAVNKWKFQDAMMGEQYVTFTITSEKPIDWAVGDFCVFRGETYTLNYIPSVTQKAGTNERLDAYTYENVKFESRQEELTRCTMLDITSTTGEYVAALGTNYTGSSRFSLYCGEVVVEQQPSLVLPAVCVLAAKIQANLDRMYGVGVWSISVDIPNSHTDDKSLSFNNTSVQQALKEVHDTFDLSYCIRGRSIYIGFKFADVTGTDDIIKDTSNPSTDTFVFGYGKGYPTHSDMNKGLFQIKRISKSSQKIVTRLRAYGSSKNLPNRYYHKTYGGPDSPLSQTLFVPNLQLPDTFEEPSVKASNNALRDPSLLAVKGDTNDAYIEKDNDAEHCAEGVREDCAFFDGTDSDLPEIYPTIHEVTYGELRGALVEDQDRNTGNGSFPNYSSDERIDKLLAVGYKDASTLVDDANVGDGIIPDGASTYSLTFPFNYNIGNRLWSSSNPGDFTKIDDKWFYNSIDLFTIQGVSPGRYSLTPPSDLISLFAVYPSIPTIFVFVGYEIHIKQRNIATEEVTEIATYRSSPQYVNVIRSNMVEIPMPEIPDAKNGDTSKVDNVTVTAFSDIIVSYSPYFYYLDAGFNPTFNIKLSNRIGRSFSNSNEVPVEYYWFPVDGSDILSQTFHVFIQDIGFNLKSCWTSETPVLSMRSGYCVGRDFEIQDDIQEVTYGNKHGYMLTLKRSTDSSLGSYYPSETNPLSAGDYFVLLNISMPVPYIKAAELRLLRAATDYLNDNCETQFTYQPYIDELYLQRNLDKCRQEGHEEQSIFWRLYAGLKLSLRGVPTSSDAPLPLLDEITIERVTITMGDGLLPKVELVLNDDLQQSTLEKLTTSVDRIYNGSLFSNGVGGITISRLSSSLLSLLQSEGGKMFLSKSHADTASGVITFLKGFTSQMSSVFFAGLVSKARSVFEKGFTVGVDEKYGMTSDGSMTASSLDSGSNSPLIVNSDIDARGHVSVNSLKSTGSNGVVPDTDNNSTKPVGLEVRESGIIGGVLRVAKSILTKTLQSLNFSGGDSLFGTGWQLTDDDGSGRSRLIVDNMIVRGKFTADTMEVRKLFSMGGNYVFSPAASVIEEVDYFDDGGDVLGYDYIKVPWLLRLIPLSLSGRYLSRKSWVRSTMTPELFNLVKFYRCWLKSDDGSTKTVNTWQVGMLARCQTFDVSQMTHGSHTDSAWVGKSVSNKLYWRAVVSVGEGVTKSTYNKITHVLDDGREHNYIDLANYSWYDSDDNEVPLYLSGSDHVDAGDHIVCYGDWKDVSLSNLVSIETVGSEAPVIRELAGVGYTDGQSIDWSLTGKELTRISPLAGDRFVAPEFIIQTSDSNKSLRVEDNKGVAVVMLNSNVTRGTGVVGDIVLYRYSNFKTANYHIGVCTRSSSEDPFQLPLYTLKKVDLGDSYVCQSDGHLYVSGESGWQDKGLVDESHSELKVTQDAIAARVTSAEGNISELTLNARSLTSRITDAEGNISIIQQTATGLSSEISQMKSGKNLLSGVLTGAGWHRGVIESGALVINGTAVMDETSGGNWISVGTGSDTLLVSPSFTIESNKSYAISFEANNSDAIRIALWSVTDDQFLVNWQTSSGDTLRTTGFNIPYSDTVRLVILSTAVRFPQVELGSSATVFEAGDKQVSSRITQTADVISTRITGAEGNISTLQQTSSMLLSFLAHVDKIGGTALDKVSDIRDIIYSGSDTVYYLVDYSIYTSAVKNVVRISLSRNGDVVTEELHADIGEGWFNTDDGKLYISGLSGWYESEQYSSIIQTMSSIILAVRTEIGYAGVNLDGQNSNIKLIAGKVDFVDPNGVENSKVSIDPTTGTLHAMDGDFGGVVNAKGFTTQFRDIRNLNNGGQVHYAVYGDNGIWNFMAGSGASSIDFVILPTNSYCYPGQRVTVYCPFISIGNGEKVAIVTGDWEDEQGMTNFVPRPFRGVGLPINTSGSGPYEPVLINSYTPVYEIDISDGLIELMCVPTTDTQDQNHLCDWCVVNVGTNLCTLRDINSMNSL